MNEVLQSLQDQYKEMHDSKMISLKSELAILGKSLKEKEQQKEEMALKIKDLNQEIKEIQMKIYNVWGPHIVGAETATIECSNGIIIKSSPKLNVSVEEREKAIEWLMSNGYDGALKWDLNTQTLYSIAREKFNENSFVIPGIEVKTFHQISAK